MVVCMQICMPQADLTMAASMWGRHATAHITTYPKDGPSYLRQTDGCKVSKVEARSVRRNQRENVLCELDEAGQTHNGTLRYLATRRNSFLVP